MCRPFGDEGVRRTLKPQKPVLLKTKQKSRFGGEVPLGHARLPGPGARGPPHSNLQLSSRVHLKGFSQRVLKNWGVGWESHPEGLHSTSVPPEASSAPGDPLREETRWGSVNPQTTAAFLDASKMFPPRTQNTNIRNH